MGTPSVIKVLFSLMTLATLALGGLIIFIEPYLPIFIVQIFRYGKFAYKGIKTSILKPIEVPKSWFKHFYIFSSILCTIALCFVFGSYVFNFPVPVWLRSFLDYLSGTPSPSRVSASVTLIAMVLLSIQCFRRLYDTQYVSVFGAQSRINVNHYLLGFIHYFGAVAAILIEAPNFSLNSNKVFYFRWNDLYLQDIAAIILFLWACLHQYKVTVILANLRKNKKGKVVSDAHYMPEGDWFKYVSSPHLLAEVLMYFSLTVILWRNTTWKYIFAWVLSNQVETALLGHWWYKDTFAKYPEERKAIFPFIL